MFTSLFVIVCKFITQKILIINRFLKVMLRRKSKSIQSDHLDIARLQFETFKKKYQEVLTDVDQQSFAIATTSNAIVIGIVVANMIRGYITVDSVKNSFKNLDFLHIDRQNAKYLNQQNLSFLMKNTILKIKDADSAARILNYYPIVKFVLNIYARNRIADTLNEIERLRKQELIDDLMGNQQQILSDYKMEIRGVLLHLLGHSLENSIEIIHNQNNIIEEFGTNNNNKLSIKVQLGSLNKVIINLQQVHKIQYKNIRMPVLSNASKQLLNLTAYRANTPFQAKSDRYTLSKENAIQKCKECNKKPCNCQPQKTSNKTIDLPQSSKRLSRGQKPCRCQKLLCRKCK